MQWWNVRSFNRTKALVVKKRNGEIASSKTIIKTLGRHTSQDNVTKTCGRGRRWYRNCGRGRDRGFDEDKRDKNSSRTKWVKCNRCDQPGHSSDDCLHIITMRGLHQLSKKYLRSTTVSMESNYIFAVLKNAERDRL